MFNRLQKSEFLLGTFIEKQEKQRTATRSCYSLFVQMQWSKFFDPSWKLVFKNRIFHKIKENCSIIASLTPCYQMNQNEVKPAKTEPLYNGHQS